MAKLEYLARTLDNPIVKDGIRAVSALDKRPETRGFLFYGRWNRGSKLFAQQVQTTDP